MRLNLRFRPVLVDALRNYDRAKLLADLAAGVTVGVVALPLAMAFAIASGLKPEAGIFTAIVAGFLISAFGGSRVQIGGPAGAFIVIVYGIVERYGVGNLMLATMFAGVVLFAMGVARLGTLIRFVPVAIVIGFTNGIAVLIALSQVKDLLGLAVDEVPAEFFAKLAVLARHLGSADLRTIALAAVSLTIVLAWPKSYSASATRTHRWLSRVPGTIVALVVGTVAVSVFDLKVETIGSRFGGIPRSLPAFEFPGFDWSTVQFLLAPTLTIALLGAIESLLCARVADAMTEERHDPNQELMGQGIANFVAPLFGGFCATGTIARTVTNIRSGAASPVAGMIHAATLLAIVLVAAPLAKNIPLATLAAILLFVAYNMGEWREFGRLRHFSVNYRTILVVTFVLTVVVDLTVAVEVGLLLACLFFITRISTLTRVEPVDPLEAQAAGFEVREVEAFRVVGSLFFGAISKLEHLLDPKRPTPRVMILDTSAMLNLDTTGLEAIRGLHGMLRKRGSVLVLSGLKGQPASLAQRSGFAEVLGASNIVEALPAAWERARELVAQHAAGTARDPSAARGTVPHEVVRQEGVDRGDPGD